MSRLRVNIHACKIGWWVHLRRRLIKLRGGFLTVTSLALFNQLFVHFKQATILQQVVLGHNVVEVAVLFLRDVTRFAIDRVDLQLGR